MGSCVFGYNLRFNCRDASCSKPPKLFDSFITHLVLKWPRQCYQSIHGNERCEHTCRPCKYYRHEGHVRGQGHCNVPSSQWIEGLHHTGNQMVVLAYQIQGVIARKGWKIERVLPSR